MDVRDYYYQLKDKPKMASSQDIASLIQILEKRNLRFPSDKIKGAVIFQEYIKELPSRVYFDALPFILEHLTIDNSIIDHNFFPTMKEIIKVQDEFMKSFYRIKPILEIALQNYVDHKENFAQLKQRMIAHDAAIGRENNLEKG